MPASAPRLRRPLTKRLERLARTDSSFADIRRELVLYARSAGIAPPSYEHVRRLVTAARLQREVENELRDLAIGVALGTTHGNELVNALREHIDG